MTVNIRDRHQTEAKAKHINEIMAQVKIVIPHTFCETFHKHPTQVKVEKL